MNHILKNQVSKIGQGTMITGKWHSNRYKIIRKLGYGATGYVYLASCKLGQVAIKISDNHMSITSEVNVLRHFAKVQGETLGPSLLDVDDWVQPGSSEATPFYVMEYMDGDPFLTFLKDRGPEWHKVLILQLLADLEKLHQAGWVFGDLKPENLLVVGPPPKVRWLDVGGTTMIGRSIKEYTEFFDRGYWGLGSRKAEPSYDLFALAMIMINAAYPDRFEKKQGDSLPQLIQYIQAKPGLRLQKPVLVKALKGEYAHAGEMRQELINTLTGTRKDQRKSTRKKGAFNKTSVRVKQQVTTPAAKPKQRKIKGLIETVLIAAVLFLGYVIYLFGQFV